MMLFMQSVAQELAPHRIRVNSIAARSHPDADQPRRVGDSRGVAAAPHADPLRAHRPARGHRQGGGVARVGRRRLRPRADPLRRRRHDPLPGVRPWRLASRPLDRRGAAPRRGAGDGRPTGSAGGRTWPSASGARSARTTRPTGRPGTTSRTTTPARARTAGARTASWGSPTTTSALCFALALWNGRDPILKERLFGLTGPEGNHGEDVKECYFYLDATPTHSYMRALYKYPQREYPYARLVEENARRGREKPEFELLDTGVFDDDRYFDVAGGVREGEPERRPRPRDRRQPGTGGGAAPRAADALVPEHVVLGAATRGSRAWSGSEAPAGAVGRARGASRALAGLPPLRRGDAAAPLHRERDQRPAPVRRRPARRRAEGRLPRARSSTAGTTSLLPDEEGTKVAAQHRLDDSAGRPDGPAAPARRRGAGGALRTGVRPRSSPRASARPTSSTRRWSRERLGEDARRVMRQALAGMLWSKQWYHYDVRRWLEGDPGQPPPPPERQHGPQRRVDAPLQRRRRLDAGQVGVPVVRGLGPGVPHDRARAGRSRLREGAARPLPARVVHAPERPDPRLRVGVRRREPAGPRLGGLARLQDREADPGRRRPAVPRARLPEAPPELHLVGEPQGPRREERLPGGLPRPRQHRGLRPLGAAARSAATSSSPTARRGSGCTA